MFTIIALAVYKKEKSNQCLPICNKSWLFLPEDYICMFRKAQSVWFIWWADACHAILDEKLVSILWPCLLWAVRWFSLGYLSFCCASDQNNILLLVIINNSLKCIKWTHTQKKMDINLIRSLDKATVCLCILNFQAYIISSNIETSREM